LDTALGGLGRRKFTHDGGVVRRCTGCSRAERDGLVRIVQMCSRCASCPGSVLHAQDVADPRSNQTSTLPSSTSRITRGTLGSPPLYFCREICSFLFLVVFSQLEQFSKPLSSFSLQIDIGVLCFLADMLVFLGPSIGTLQAPFLTSTPLFGFS